MIDWETIQYPVAGHELMELVKDVYASSTIEDTAVFYCPYVPQTLPESDA